MRGGRSSLGTSALQEEMSHFQLFFHLHSLNEDEAAVRHIQPHSSLLCLLFIRLIETLEKQSFPVIEAQTWRDLRNVIPMWTAVLVCRKCAVCCFFTCKMNFNILPSPVGRRAATLSFDRYRNVSLLSHYRHSSATLFLSPAWCFQHIRAADLTFQSGVRLQPSG